MIVLVPAYEPDERLVALVGTLVREKVADGVLVVDDGSGPDYAKVFADAAAAGAEVIGHSPNKGKGVALKVGFDHVARRHPGHAVVCADCDGQHEVTGIRAVGAEVHRSPGQMVLGTRRFVGRMPIASRVGNTLTRVLFARTTGRQVFDTQTGLRGYSADLLPWLCGVEGDRFEYELNLLLRGAREGIGCVEVPIDTIYIDGNSSTHFRPVVDSIRVYAPLARFGASSIAAFLVDFTLLFVLHAVTGVLWLSAVGARVASSALNFSVNRRLVFDGDRHGSMLSSAIRYFGLVAAILTVNIGLLHLLADGLGLPLVAAKILTELALFTASYEAQKHLIFRARHG